MKSARLQAGDLIYRVTIKEPKDFKSGSGQPTDEAEVIAKPFVSIVSVGGLESYRGQQIEAGVTTLVRMHFRRDLKPTMRIEHNDRQLEIVSTYDPHGTRIETWCNCKEIA